MGQKVNPHGIRVGVIKDWDSRWFASKKDFSDNLVEDHKIRTELKTQKWEKMVERMSGVVMSPVMVERWWMVSRTSWAMRSAGRVVWRPSITRRSESEACRRA